VVTPRGYRPTGCGAPLTHHDEAHDPRTGRIATHVDGSLARREPLSALVAAEAGVRGRFGYGPAADDVHLTLPRGGAPGLDRAHDLSASGPGPR